MNIRKPIDYSEMYAGLDKILNSDMQQMKVFCEIGRLVDSRPEKGAAVAAAEYINNNYSGRQGFSPRSLRRMRDFYRSYKNDPVLMDEAMKVCWSLNAVIIESCESVEERAWYIRAVQTFKWSKTELVSRIAENAYESKSLDSHMEECYTRNTNNSGKNLLSQQRISGGSMAIHSHIQLPNGILKYFRDESDPEKKVWYLDISSGEIRRKQAGRLGTSKGYYSEEVEEFWNKYVETPIGRLNSKIREFCAGEIKTLPLSLEDQNIFRRYIKAAAVRSNLANDSMKKESLTAEFFTDQENHDALAYFGMRVSGEFDRLIEDMDVTILVNRTDRNLVVPRNCYYAVSSLEKETLVAPISPKGALLFLPRDYSRISKEHYAVVENPDYVSKMNVLALKYEYIFNGDFVASNCRTELEFLQEIQKEYKPTFEALRQNLEANEEGDE